MRRAGLAARAGWLAGAGCVLAAGGCGGSSRDEVRPFNVLLVTVDTLRADRLGCYGYGRPISPALDRLAAESVVFERAYASSSWTLPSLASLLSSRHPSTHGCTGDFTPLAPGFDTLAERLQGAGYRTGAVTSHVYLAPRYGLDQGFDDYDAELARDFAERQASHTAISSPEITRKALEWIDANAHADRPWLLWAHYFDPHHVYQDHAGGADFGATPSDLYDGEIAWTDRHVGEVLERVSQLGLGDDTVIIVVADHGEEFGDHGGTMHRGTLYEEVLRVPLIVRVPGLAARRVRAPVSITDVAPTILRLVGAAPLEAADGVDLGPALRGEKLERGPILAELSTRTGRKDALIDGRFKLVRDVTAGRFELFDIESDPAERTNLAESEPSRRNALARSLRESVEAARTRAGVPQTIELSGEDRSELKSLGYGD